MKTGELPQKKHFSPISIHFFNKQFDICWWESGSLDLVVVAFDGPDGQNQQEYLEDVDDDEEEDAEIVHRPKFLPDSIGGIVFGPDRQLDDSEKKINDEEEDNCPWNLPISVCTILSARASFLFCQMK